MLSLRDLRLAVVCFVCSQGSRDYFGIAVLWSHRHVVPRLCDSWTFSGLAPIPWGPGVWPGKQPSSHHSWGILHFSIRHVHLLLSSFFVLPSSFLSQHLSNGDAGNTFKFYDSISPLCTIAHGKFYPLCSRLSHSSVPYSCSPTHPNTAHVAV